MDKKTKKAAKSSKIPAAKLAKSVTSAESSVDMALPASEFKYRTIFDSASDAIIIHDLNGNILDVNKIACDRLGFTREELLRMTPMGIDSPEYAQLVSERIHQIITKKHIIFETCHISKDGTRIPTENSSRFIEYEGKQAILSSCRDITERMLADEKLKKSEIRLKESQEVARIGSWSWKIVNNTLEWSAETFRRFDKDPATFITSVEYFVNLIHPDDRETAQKAIQDSLENYAPYHVQARIINETGREWVMEAFGRVERDTNGKPLRFAGTAQDITERIQVDEARSRSEKRYHTLFEESPDGILLIDAVGKIIEFNEAAHCQLGYSREEFAKLSLSDIDPVESPEEIQARIRKVLKDGKAEFEATHITKRGEIRHVCVITRVITISGQTAFHTIWQDITERKRIENKLTHIMKAVESTSDAIGISDALGHHFYQNKAFSDLYGYATAEELELAGGGAATIKDPEVAEEMYDKIMHGKSWVGELELVTKSGRVFPGFERADAIKDNEGNIVGLIGIIRDISEQKKAEEALLYFQMAVESSTDAIGMSTPEGRHYYQNEAYTRMFGLSVSEVDGVSGPPSTVYADGKEGKKIFDIIMNGGSFEGEVKMLDKDRKEKDIYLRAYSIKTKEGKVVGLVGSHNDITDRKQAEIKIVESERFIRNILDTVDEGFISVSRDFRIILANKAYCSQVGMADDEVVGRHCYEVSHKSIKPCFEEGEDCAVRHVFETGEPYGATHRHTDRKEEILYVATKAFPIRDSSGAITSVIETVQNITEKHLLEEERLKTQKLEAIGTLAGGIAHDFNNLLQGVFGYISMAKMSLDSGAKSFAMLEQAEKALHMSVNLTTQLLTFSKGGKPVKKRVTLQPVIENSVRFALSGSRSDYGIKLDSDLWHVEADEGQLGQVIQNIVLNSDQAMPMGGTILITAKNIRTPQKGIPQLPGKGNYVEISIQDSGIGISEEYLSKIFDPYFTTKVKGSGLGLATCYSIIKNHNGVIHVSSKMGNGTAFYVYLPAIEAEKELPKPTELAQYIRKGKILVMDDDEMIRNIAGDMIKALGHDVELAGHGDEAIGKYKAAMESGNPFDIVILDLTIRGGMGGKETIERLLAVNSGIKAVVSSGYSDDAVVSDYNNYGFRARLTKPYKFEELRDTLNKLLNK